MANDIDLDAQLEAANEAARAYRRLYKTAEADCDTLAAQVERLRAALATIGSEMLAIADGKQDEVRSDISAGEARQSIWAALDDIQDMLNGYGVPTPERTYVLDGGWSLALSDIRKYIYQLHADIANANRTAESWKTSCARLVKTIETNTNTAYVMEAERDALRVELEREVRDASE